MVMEYVKKVDMINYIWWYEGDKLMKMSLKEYWYLKRLEEEERYDSFLNRVEGYL